MKQFQHTTPLFRGKLFGLLICLLLGGVLLASPAYAELPPRPTEPPKPEETPTPRPLVAPLVLNVTPAQSGLWSVVQWQDAQGGWQDVESWRGWVVNGQTIWWVEQKDFGKGPFRWAVFQTQGGSLLAVSDPFRLPDQPRRTLTVVVTLP